MIRPRLLFVCALLYMNYYAQADFYNPLNRKNFADYLYKTEDYNRAGDEYLSVFRLTSNDTALYKYGLAMLKTGRYEESSEGFKKLFQTSLSKAATRQYMKISLITGKAGELNKEFLDFAKSDTTALRLLLLDSIIFHQSYPEKAALKIFGEDAGRIELFCLEAEAPNKNDPFKAAVFSALIPGLGKIYAGKTSDGITGFVLTGITAWLAYNKFERGRNTLGWFFAAASGGLYFSGIYGAAVAASAGNYEKKEKIYREFIQSLEEKNYFMDDNDLD